MRCEVATDRRLLCEDGDEAQAVPFVPPAPDRRPCGYDNRRPKNSYGLHAGRVPNPRKRVAPSTTRDSLARRSTAKSNRRISARTRPLFSDAPGLSLAQVLGHLLQEQCRELHGLDFAPSMPPNISSDPFEPLQRSGRERNQP